MTDTLLIILVGWTIEAVFGWPNWLYKIIRHPVVWLGTLISAVDQFFNREADRYAVRYTLGALTSMTLIMICIALGWGIAAALSSTLWGLWGLCLQAVIASSLIASRSMYAHVRAVAAPLDEGRKEDARQAVSMIVGRGTAQLDEAGIAKAALESLAENTSDGVTAPIFWGAIFGLPGLAGYKAINTLDSMIGHRSARYHAFGGFAARLDDAANLIPARLTGVLFVLASGSANAWRAMVSDAGKHVSPNAGWPEAALAGALQVRLGGPRHYANAAKDADAAWLNAAGRDPMATDIAGGLALYLRALAILAGMLILCLSGLAL